VKAKVNLDKHGISFEEAVTVFYDEAAIEFYDDEHSDWEDRFLLLGLSSDMKLLLVCHCYRSEESVIRIISARKATEMKQPIIKGESMEKEYDLSKMKKRRNPYAKQLKKTSHTPAATGCH